MTLDATPRGARGRRTSSPTDPFDPLDDLLSQAIHRAASDRVVNIWLRRLAAAECDGGDSGPRTPVEVRQAAAASAALAARGA